MAKIILVVFCGALVFVLVSRFAPHFIETYINPKPEATTEEATPADAPKAKPALKKPTSATKDRSTRIAGTFSSPTTVKGDLLASTLVTTELAASPIPAGADTSPDVPLSASLPSDGLVRINRDNATLYSTN